MKSRRIQKGLILRSVKQYRTERGFTLERIRDASDRRSEYKVRQAASAVASCITREQTKPAGTPFAANNCESSVFLGTNSYVSNVATVTGAGFAMTSNTTDNICIEDDNPSGHGTVYWDFISGLITSAETGPSPGAPCTLPYP
jgi:hypothetical protein